MTKTFTESCLHGARRAPRFLALLAAVLLAGAFALPAAALADTPTLDVPKHVKTATLNDDGTATVTLNVTGDTDTETSTSKANVIVVLDVSESMNQKVGSGRNSKTRLQIAKEAVNSLATKLIGDENSTIQLSLVTFSKAVVTNTDYYKGGQATSFNTLVNNVTTSQGTNWYDAMLKANEKASKDLSTPTYIIFLSDGDPTCGKNNYSRPDSSQTETYFQDAVTEATKKDRPSNIKALYSVYTGSDAATRMNQFSNTVQGINAFDGTDSDKLNAALADIAESITTSVAYKDVVITDTLSDSVEFALAEGQTAPAFTYTKTYKNAAGETVTETWADAPSAAVDENGKMITWDLANVGKLAAGVTYSVSFNVQPTQAEFDNAAEAEGEYRVYTNAAAAEDKQDESGTLTYKTVTTVGTKETVSDANTVTYERPTIPVATSTITVSKEWKGKDTHPESLTVTITRANDDDYSKTVTLSDDNNWTADAKVSAGPDGHTYTVTETVPDGWTSNQPEGGYKITLKGLTAQEDKTTASFTNTFIPYGLSIFKYTAGDDEKQTPLKGAIFTVTGPIDGVDVSYTLTTDDTGYAKTEKVLTDGVYTITETSVPAGYDKLTYSLTLTVKGDTATLSDGTKTAEVSADDGYFKVSIGNTPSAPAEIPSTGGMGNVPLYIAGVAVIAGVVTVLVKRLS